MHLESRVRLAGDDVVDAGYTRSGFASRSLMLADISGDNAETRASVLASAPATTPYVVTRSWGVETIPTITFSSTRVEVATPHSYRVTGDLTVRDVTETGTVEFGTVGAAEHPWGHVRVGFEGHAIVYPKDWQVGVATADAVVGEESSAGPRVHAPARAGEGTRPWS